MLELHLLLSVSLQALLWGWLYDEQAWPSRCCLAWLKRSGAREAAVLANARPQLETYGITEPSVLLALWLGANISVPLHHALATAAAMAAYLNGSATLLRVGLSFEIGENALHYAQMAWTALRPARGVSPWRFMDRKTWAFAMLHHTLGLVAGSAAFLSHVCEWPELQLFVAVVLGAGLPCYLKTPLQLRADLAEPSAAGRAAAAIDVASLAVLVAVRLGWAAWSYMPMARALIDRCREHADCSAGFYAVPLLYVFPLFNVCSVLLFGQYTSARVLEQLKDKKA